MRFVKVVTNTLSPLSAAALISAAQSSTCPAIGRTVISGSSRPVGRIICSATASLTESSKGDGVADTNTVCPVRESNSLGRSGLLSSALGSLKPYSISRSLRALSPLYMPLICGQVTWLSSMNRIVSFGKKSSRHHGREPAGRPARWRE